MLMNLLPGLRDLRTPLAAGYVWLVGLWFLLRDHAPARKGATGIALSAYKLIDIVGSPALLAAGSFVAYVVGSSVSITPGRLRKQIFTWGGLSLGRKIFRSVPLAQDMGPDEPPLEVPLQGHVPPFVDHGSLYNLRGHLWEMAREAAPEFYAGSAREDLGWEGTEQDIIQNLSDVSMHLQIGKPELYQDYDRMASEASFKVNVGLAIGVLSVALTAASGNLWYAILLAPVAIMMRSGIHRQQSANNLLVAVITSRVITVPALSRYEQALQKKEQRYNQQAAA
ncbi:hypothetical protein ACIRS1_02855 [Kitasatospora sp. NPDC101176]|uniref:hypothetical protein n=1 Tax=Kitasatospora sp. NPDC101176 TaxID=3364099 RepID=UPI00381A830A